MKVFRLEGAGSAHGHLDVSRSRGLSSFVGRADEVAELEAAFDRSLAGSRRGDRRRRTRRRREEPPVSGVRRPVPRARHPRLSRRSARPTRRRSRSSRCCRCCAVPLRDRRRRLRHRGPGQDPGGAAGPRGRPRHSRGPRAGLDFLGVRAPDAPEIPMKGDARNRRLRDLVRRLVQATNREPSVVLVEDLQWVDPASAVFLETLVEAVPGSGGLVVATFRPEFRAGWMSGSHYRQLPLTTLPQDALEALLAELLGPDRLPRRPVRADLRTHRRQPALRRGDRPGAGRIRHAGRRTRRLPDGPRDRRAAGSADRPGRSSRPGSTGSPPEAKVTLQTAAAIGSETSRELLSEVVDLDDEALDQAHQSADRDRVPARDRPLPRADPRVPAPADPGDRLRLAARPGPCPLAHRGGHGAAGDRSRAGRRERRPDRPALRAGRRRDEGRRVAPAGHRMDGSPGPDGVHPPRAPGRRSRPRHPERRRR